MSDGRRDYKLGTTHGVRWAITWLHERARQMNDPHAKAILNSAGFNMGVDAKDVRFVPAGAPWQDFPPTDEVRG